MLAGANQIKVLALNLIHHAIHIGLAHHALHHVAMNHKGRDAVGKALVNHKIPTVGKDRLVKPRDIPKEIIEAVSGNPARGVKVNTIKRLHDFSMVRHRKVRGLGLAESLDLHIFAVVFSDGHRVVNHLGNQQHFLVQLNFQLGLQMLQLSQTIRLLLDLDLERFRFFLLGRVLLCLSHQDPNLL